MLSRRIGRRANIEPTMVQFLVLAGNDTRGRSVQDVIRYYHTHLLI